MHEYDVDRWRIISGKVGNGFSASACKEKALEMAIEEGEREDEDETTIAALSRRASYTAASLLSETSTTATAPMTATAVATAAKEPYLPDGP